MSHAAGPVSSRSFAGDGSAAGRRHRCGGRPGDRRARRPDLADRRLDHRDVTADRRRDPRCLAHARRRLSSSRSEVSTSPCWPCASGSSPSTRCFLACTGFVMAMGFDQRQVRGNPTSPCRATACSPASSPSPRRCASISSWAAVIIGAIAGVLVVPSVAFFSTAAASTTRAARSPCTACAVRSACRVGLFADVLRAGWNGVNGNVKGLLYGDGGSSSTDVARPRRIRVGVGGHAVISRPC